METPAVSNCGDLAARLYSTAHRLVSEVIRGHADLWCRPLDYCHSRIVDAR